MITSKRSKRSLDRVNYLASVSDLMSALLFVFILTLSVAIVQARTATSKAEQEAKNARIAEQDLRQVKERLTAVENRLEGNAKALRQLLNALQKNLKQQGVSVDLDESKGVLRIPETAVTFNVGESTLNAVNQNRLRMIGTALATELQCYKNSKVQTEFCRKQNPNGNTLDAVFIEGHTDNQTYRGDQTGHRNRLLSTARSNTIFDAMVLNNRELENMQNAKGEPLFSLSGYGSSRPLPGHEHPVPTNDPANRRIEFRFIMTPPALSAEESHLIRAQDSGWED